MPWDALRVATLPTRPLPRRRQSAARHLRRNSQPRQDFWPLRQWAGTPETGSAGRWCCRPDGRRCCAHTPVPLARDQPLCSASLRPWGLRVAVTSEGLGANSTPSASSRPQQAGPATNRPSTARPRHRDAFSLWSYLHPAFLRYPPACWIVLRCGFSVPSLHSIGHGHSAAAAAI
jgi:hypothetical protein